MYEIPEPEIFTPERIAEFLLNNSLSREQFRRNLTEVLLLGVDPLSIDPAFLSRDEPWQRVENHQDILRARRSS